MPTSIETNKPFFEEQMKRLQSGLKGSYTKEQINIIFNQTKKFKTNHLVKTVEHLLIAKTFLPPANDIIAGCRVEAYGDEQKENQEEKQFADELFEGEVQPHGKMAKDAMQLVVDVLNKKITKHQLYQKMLTMDGVYPGEDWKKEANKMMQPKLKLAEGE